MVISVDRKSESPLYLQTRDQIIAGIARGDLVRDDPLPSARQLASDLGINLHAVSRAYAVLRDEGHLFVPARFGIGWTMNWACPATWTIVGIFAIVTIAFAVACVALLR